MSHFPKSPWTLIHSIAELKPESTERELAIRDFCELYSGPVFACAQRHFPFSDPADITQDVFEYIIAKDLLTRADRGRGKLRTYLFHVIKGIASKSYRKDARSRKPLPFDPRACQSFAAGFIGMPEAEPSRHLDTLIARQVFRRSLDRLVGVYRERGQGELVEGLMDAALQGASSGSIDGDPKVSDGAWRLHLHRFRKRLRCAFRTEVEQSLNEAGAAEIEEEMSYLLELLNQRGTL